MPVRIQRKRTKGWKAPEGAVYVGRPGKWGNPFKVGFYGVDDAMRLYRRMLDDSVLRGSIDYPSDAAIRRELRGKNLMCFCKLDHPCHADVLLEIANA